MKRFAATCFLLLALSSSAIAQDRFLEVIARATWIDSTGDSLDFNNEEDYGLEFHDEIGFGLAANVFLTNSLSLEVGASLVEPDFLLVIDDPDGPRSTEGLEMIPVTAALQLHLFGQSRLDPYIGAGGTYLIFDDVDSIEDITENDVEAIEFDDNIGWMVNAGVNIGFLRTLALNLDVKYSEVELDGAVTFDRGDFTAVRAIEFNPVLVSAGLSWRF